MHGMLLYGKYFLSCNWSSKRSRGQVTAHMRGACFSLVRLSKHLPTVSETHSWMENIHWRCPNNSSAKLFFGLSVAPTEYNLMVHYMATAYGNGGELMGTCHSRNWEPSLWVCEPSCPCQGHHEWAQCAPGPLHMPRVLGMCTRHQHAHGSGLQCGHVVSERFAITGLWHQPGWVGHMIDMSH